jgi:hypothetical protein
MIALDNLAKMSSSCLARRLRTPQDNEGPSANPDRGWTIHAEVVSQKDGAYRVVFGRPLAIHTSLWTARIDYHLPEAR